MSELERYIKSKIKALGYIGTSYRTLHRRIQRDVFQSVVDANARGLNAQQFCRDRVEHWMLPEYTPFNSIQGLYATTYNDVLTEYFGSPVDLEKYIPADKHFGWYYN